MLMKSQIKSTCCHGVVVVLVSWLFDGKLSDQGMGLRLAVKKERKLEGLKFRFGKNKNRKKKKNRHVFQFILIPTLISFNHGFAAPCDFTKDISHTEVFGIVF